MEDEAPPTPWSAPIEWHVSEHIISRYGPTTLATELSAVIWMPPNRQRTPEVPLPAPRPDPEPSGVRTILLYGMIARGWDLVDLLPVTLEQDEDGRSVVSDDLFTVYGEGETKMEALRDYFASLIEYYQLLAVRATPEDPPVQAQFHHLRRYLRPSG